MQATIDMFTALGRCPFIVQAFVCAGILIVSLWTISGLLWFAEVIAALVQYGKDVLAYQQWQEQERERTEAEEWAREEALDQFPESFRLSDRDIDGLLKEWRQSSGYTSPKSGM